MVNINKINKNELGKILIPNKIQRMDYKKELEEVYEKLYYNKINYVMITNLFFLSILISFIAFIYFYPALLNNGTFGPLIQSSLILKFIIIYLSFVILNILVYNSVLLGYFLYHDGKFKKYENEIEKDLPEFIDNLVSNLKGGISLERAFLKSVRPEQKALLKEMTLINEKILMGKSVEQALIEFRNRFDSAVLNRTFFLMGEGIKGGGNLAAPLERISQNLKRITNLNEEIKANAGGFAIIIKGITIIVAPLLFALALTLLNFIGQLFSLLSESNSQLGFVASVPEEFTIYLNTFSIAMIVMITFFSSLITSQLKNEKTYTAIKYLPIYIIISLFLFKSFSGILLGFFGGIIG
ncbi:MAG: type II secretion system F family protein [Nanoarchaeales archaeon]|nr:type II secretion system F family protein [Nanoarchaeales archaeon]